MALTVSEQLVFESLLLQLPCALNFVSIICRRVTVRAGLQNSCETGHIPAFKFINFLHEPIPFSLPKTFTYIKALCHESTEFLLAQVSLLYGIHVL